MKREQVLEDQIGINDYGSGKVFEDSDDDNEIQKQVTKAPKFCKWCVKNTNHKTWTSKHCVAHDEYKKYKSKLIKN